MQVLKKFVDKTTRSLIIISTPLALLLSANPTKAILNINMVNDGSDLKIITSGALSDLGGPKGVDSCGVNGALFPDVLCTGVDNASTTYALSGPQNFGAAPSFRFPASSVFGPSFLLNAFSAYYAIDPSYSVGEEFLSSATFNNTSLSAQGFTTPGLIATWTIVGTSESINLFVGPPPAEVPGPLPLLGAGAAFGWSRRLRRRIVASVSAPPQA